MAGWYELRTNDKKEYSFVLKSENGEIVLRSEQYKGKDSAMKGIASVQKNSSLQERYDRKEASDGRSYFNLKAGNYQIIGTSQMYKSAANRDAGVESVMINGQTPVIKTAV